MHLVIIPVIDPAHIHSISAGFLQESVCFSGNQTSFAFHYRYCVFGSKQAAPGLTPYTRVAHTAASSWVLAQTHIYSIIFFLSMVTMIGFKRVFVGV